MVRELLERIARATAQYLKSQIAAGAAVVQLFDTWAGELTRAEYDAFELPATQNGLRSARPRGGAENTFRKRLSALLESLAASGADVISVDWRTDLAEARAAFDRTAGRKSRCRETWTQIFCWALKTLCARPRKPPWKKPAASATF